MKTKPLLLGLLFIGGILLVGFLWPWGERGSVLNTDGAGSAAGLSRAWDSESTDSRATVGLDASNREFLAGGGAGANGERVHDAAVTELEDDGSGEAWEESLAKIIQSLRPIAVDEDTFHGRAWPIVLRASRLAATKDAARTRLEEWIAILLNTRGASIPYVPAPDAIDTPDAVARVTGSLTLAWALSLPSAETKKADALRESACARLEEGATLPGEVARALWIALSLRSSVPRIAEPNARASEQNKSHTKGPPQGDSDHPLDPVDASAQPPNIESARSSIPIKRFWTSTRLKTYPLEFSTVLTEEVLNVSIAFAERPSGMTDTGRGVLEKLRQDRFTREVVVIALLGPAAASPGRMRDLLWKWCEGINQVSAFLADAASFALAAAARDDAALGESLIELAARRDAGRSDLGARIRLHLCAFQVLPERVAAEIAKSLTSSAASLNPLLQVLSVRALQSLLSSGDPRVVEAAHSATLQCLSDSSVSLFDRGLLVDSLAIAKSPLLLSTICYLLDAKAETKLIVNSITAAVYVPGSQSEEARRELRIRYRADAPEEIRQAIVASVARLGGEAERGWLLELAAQETSESVRAEIAKWLAQWK